jgi:hypothetical protein
MARRPSSAKRLVQISLNGKLLGTAAVAASGYATLRMKCPVSLQGLINLRFELQQPRAGDCLNLQELTLSGNPTAQAGE